MKLKFKAFTLMELVVAMIISSIVIGMGYSSYIMVYKQYLNYKSLRTELVDVAGMNAELNNNFYHAINVRKGTENELLFQFDKNKRTIFDFNERYIIRKENDLVDTFKIAGTNYHFNYIGNDQNNDKELVSSLSFDAGLLKENVHFYFEKKYSSEILIKAEIEDLNNGEN